ncbi:MAG: hypothetical protein GF329_13650 [Candidatus Lokiarchaeota archaeon]|nr:hypothetical protein [Candidatus Lokiarchaeota archaeon]
MSDPDKIVEIKKSQATIEQIQNNQYVIFKTREMAAFLKKIHDKISSDPAYAKKAIVEFLKDLAQHIKS